MLYKHLATKNTPETTMQKKRPLTKSTRYLIALWIILIILHYAGSVWRDTPLIIADEIGYLANARYLAGVSQMPSMRFMAFYHFGYSLFIIPALWLTSDLSLMYKTVMLINSLLISSLFFALYMILRELTEIQKGHAMAIAFVSCLYPSFLIQAYFAWSENAFIPVFAFMVLGFIHLLKKKNISMGIVWGFSVGFLYTIHGRALSVIAVALIYLMVLGIMKKLPKLTVCCSMATVISVYLLTIFVNRHLLTAGWLHSGFDILKYLSQLASVKGIKNFFSVGMAQCLYLSLATYGLFILGLFYVIKSTKQTILNRSKTAQIKLHTFILLLGTSAGIFTTSCLGTLSDMPAELFRISLFLHGRYNDGFVALFLMIGLYVLVFPEKSISNNRTRLWFPLLVISIFSLLPLWHDCFRTATPAFPLIDIAGIYPMVNLVGSINKLPIISLYFILCILFMHFVFKYSFRIGIVTIASYFILFYLSNFNWVMSAQENQSQVQEAFETIRHGNHIRHLSYDMAYYQPAGFCFYQYLLPEISFNMFNSKKGTHPLSEFVLSGNTTKTDYPGRFLLGENRYGHSLWYIGN